MTRIWWEAAPGAENISVNETLQSQTKHCKGLVSRRNQLLATSSLLDFQVCSFLGRIGRKRDTAGQRTRCYWLTNLVLFKCICHCHCLCICICGAENEVLLTDQPCSQTSRLQRRPSERSREHFLFVGLRHHFGTPPRHFSSNFLLALGPLVETWEIDLKFSIDFRPLDEWCELWRSDGFSPFIKSIPCCLDVHSLDGPRMSLGWSQYVSPNIWSDHNGRCWDEPAASPPNGIPTYCSMLGQTFIIGHRIMLECVNIIV